MQQEAIDETTLLQRSLAGDADAYGAVVERYKTALYRHCYTLVRDEDVAEDIAQDTFIAAYYKLHQYNTEKRFSTWLFKIATNKCLNWIKRESRLTYNDELLMHTVSSHPEPFSTSLDNELHEAVRRLRTEFQAVISLYYWQGIGYSEIAAIMGKPEGSVKVWMQRAKQELRKELA